MGRSEVALNLGMVLDRLIHQVFDQALLRQTEGHHTDGWGCSEVVQQVEDLFDYRLAFGPVGGGPGRRNRLEQDEIDTKPGHRVTGDRTCEAGLRSNGG